MEHLAIIGENAAGKSQYAKQMERDGRNVLSVAFNDAYGIADPNYYYQQRWNSCEYEGVLTVRERFGSYEESDYQRRIFEMFRLEELMEKPIIQLSSGEHRRYQLARKLVSKPDIFIIDNPYIGLDVPTRAQLDALFRELIAMGGMQLVLVLSSLDDVPEFITHVIWVKEGEAPKMTRAEYMAAFAAEDAARVEDWTDLMEKVVSLPSHDAGFGGEEVLDLRKVSIRYGSRVILKDLDWTVHKGERWALCGINGSGKSTLLSIICADNPQSYACDLSLFGRKRGTGESIWEIKKHIGYVSPELHRSYMRDVPAIEVVATGLHDRAGMYVKTKEEHLGICEFWMDVFGVLHLRDRSFVKLSFGEQRLLLLARAFVKDPELMIMDEPMHGLDTYNKRRVGKVIEAFCQRPDKTLIMVTHNEEELPPIVTGRLVLQKLV